MADKQKTLVKREPTLIAEVDESALLSFPRRRESTTHVSLDARLRGHEEATALE